MTTWQEKWNSGNTGRAMHAHFKEVSREQIPLSFKSIQVITGHGNTQYYLKRFKLKDTDGKCECALDKEESIDHILYRCTKQNRKEAREEMVLKYGNLILDLRINNVINVDNVNKFNEWAGRVLEKECMCENSSENESSE